MSYNNYFRQIVSSHFSVITMNIITRHSSKLFASKLLTRGITYNFRVKKLYIPNDIDDKAYDQDSEYHKPQYINKQQTIDKAYEFWLKDTGRLIISDCSINDYVHVNIVMNDTMIFHVQLKSEYDNKDFIIFN
jgi:hypothetical protein